MKKFGEDYPCGPCDFKGCVCECGWVYDQKEVNHEPCEDDDDCDVCMYCGNEKCPMCGRHLHCGGCI